MSPSPGILRTERTAGQESVVVRSSRAAQRDVEKHHRSNRRCASPGSRLDFFPCDILDISPVNGGIDLSVLPAPEPNATFKKRAFFRTPGSRRPVHGAVGDGP